MHGILRSDFPRAQGGRPLSQIPPQPSWQRRCQGPLTESCPLAFVSSAYPDAPVSGPEGRPKRGRSGCCQGTPGANTSACRTNALGLILRDSRCSGSWDGASRHCDQRRLGIHRARRALHLAVRDTAGFVRQADLCEQIGRQQPPPILLTTQMHDCQAAARRHRDRRRRAARECQHDQAARHRVPRDPGPAAHPSGARPASASRAAGHRMARVCVHHHRQRCWMFPERYLDTSSDPAEAITSYDTTELATTAGEELILIERDDPTRTWRIWVGIPCTPGCTFPTGEPTPAIA
jgi:hypothetical protein